MNSSRRTYLLHPLNLAQMGKAIHADSKDLTTAKDFKSIAKTGVILGKKFSYLLHYVC